VVCFSPLVAVSPSSMGEGEDEPRSDKRHHSLGGEREKDQKNADDATEHEVTQRGDVADHDDDDEGGDLDEDDLEGDSDDLDENDDEESDEERIEMMTMKGSKATISGQGKDKAEQKDDVSSGSEEDRDGKKDVSGDSDEDLDDAKLDDELKAEIEEIGGVHESDAEETEEEEGDTDSSMWGSDIEQDEEEALSQGFHPFRAHNDEGMMYMYNSYAHRFANYVKHNFHAERASLKRNEAVILQAYYIDDLLRLATMQETYLGVQRTELVNLRKKDQMRNWETSELKSKLKASQVVIEKLKSVLSHVDQERVLLTEVLTAEVDRCDNALQQQQEIEGEMAILIKNRAQDLDAATKELRERNFELEEEKKALALKVNDLTNIIDTYSAYAPPKPLIMAPPQEGQSNRANPENWASDLSFTPAMLIEKTRNKKQQDLHAPSTTSSSSSSSAVSNVEEPTQPATATKTGAPTKTFKPVQTTIQAPEAPLANTPTPVSAAPQNTATPSQNTVTPSATTSTTNSTTISTTTAIAPTTAPATVPTVPTAPVIMERSQTSQIVAAPAPSPAKPSAKTAWNHLNKSPYSQTTQPVTARANAKQGNKHSSRSTQVATARRGGAEELSVSTAWLEQNRRAAARKGYDFSEFHGVYDCTDDYSVAPPMPPGHAAVSSTVNIGAKSGTGAHSKTLTAPSSIPFWNKMRQVQTAATSQPSSHTINSQLSASSSHHHNATSGSSSSGRNNSKKSKKSNAWQSMALPKRGHFVPEVIPPRILSGNSESWYEQVRRLNPPVPPPTELPAAKRSTGADAVTASKTASVEESAPQFTYSIPHANSIHNSEFPMLVQRRLGTPSHAQLFFKVPFERGSKKVYTAGTDRIRKLASSSKRHIIHNPYMDATVAMNMNISSAASAPAPEVAAALEEGGSSSSGSSSSGADNSSSSAGLPLQKSASGDKFDDIDRGNTRAGRDSPRKVIKKKKKKKKPVPAGTDETLDRQNSDTAADSAAELAEKSNRADDNGKKSSSLKENEDKNGRKQENKKKKKTKGDKKKDKSSDSELTGYDPGSYTAKAIDRPETADAEKEKP